MAATATVVETTVETLTGDEYATVGWSTARTKIDEARQYTWTAPYALKVWRFARLDDQWYGFCWKCDGAGNIGYGPDNGVCWECSGHGLRDYWTQGEEFDTKLRNIERSVKAESTKQQKAVAKRQAEIAAWREANTEIVTWAEALTPTGTEPNDYVPSETQDVFDGYSPKVQSAIRSIRYGADLEPRTAGLLRKVIADEAATPAEVKASRHAGAEGDRLTITGKVVMHRYNDDGGYLTVKVAGEGADTGITFFTNTNSASAWDLEEGDLVQVKATIKRNEVYRVTGEKSDRVGRAVFTKVTEIPAAPAPVATVAETAPQAPVETPAPAAPASEPTAPQSDATAAPRKTGRRAALGASSVDGWELLYDKPKAGAEVVRQNGRYALACKTHRTLHHLDRLSDEGAVRKAGGWCTECH